MEKFIWRQFRKRAAIEKNRKGVTEKSVGKEPSAFERNLIPLSCLNNY
jgi:hypothetical protein